MEFNDYELIYMAKEKNEDALKYLYEKYKPLLEKKARECSKIIGNKGIEYNDVLQECMIAFQEAIDVFDQDGKALFYTFVNLCVDRQLKSLITKTNRMKNKLFNESISLDNVYDNEESIVEFIKENNTNPEEVLIDLDDESKLYDKIMDGLRDNEKEIFKLKVQGFNYIEIAEKLNKDAKSISNILYRIRNKVKRIINNENK